MANYSLPVSIEYHGSLVLVRPRTQEALDWLLEHTQGTWFTSALVVEPRYLEPLLAGLAEDLEATA